MSTPEQRLHRLEAEIERKLLERFAALRDEFDRLRVESDRRWGGFLSRFEQDCKGMVPPELLEVPASAAVSAAGALSCGAARVLDEAPNQVEVLHKYLELALRHASRLVLLITRGEAVGVWKAIGFSQHGGSDEAVRRIVLSVSPGSPLARVMDGEPMMLPAGNDISRQLGSGDATRAALIPMVVREKVSGALYADCVSAQENAFDPESLGFLTYLAGLVVDRLATRKLRPAPALRAATATAPPREMPSETAMPEAEPTGEPGLELLADSTIPPKAPPPILHFDDSSPGSGLRVSRADVFAAPAGPSAPAGAPAAEPHPPAPIVIPSSAARQPTGARRLAGPLAPGDGDERREEARRFAKLLVSEIRLYNERAVLDGLKHGNLYERLKEDIDRSRQMYDDRIPEDVRASSNFFHEELVRILADGRAEALGI
ncbi:MAG: hypothetical protein ACRD00_05455 [Thermoanaerobaculia bacterium]